MKNAIRGIYAIVDGGLIASADLTGLARMYVDSGIKVIQLRMKGEDKLKVLDIAKKIARLKSSHNFTFIINDHADIASDVGADGVHVGENDAPVSEIKQRYGSKLIVGYSSHSVEEAKRAQEGGADYIAFGAIFPTKTKGSGHPVQGLEKLRELRRLINAPLVAIGGIGRHNFADVLETGVDAVAMITALSEAEDVEAEAKWFVKNFT